MIENETNRRPSGPPPTSFNSAPKPAHVPSETPPPPSPEKAPSTVKRRVGKTWGAIASLIAVGVIVAVMWPFITTSFDRVFGDKEEGLAEGNIYDFKQVTSSDSPIGDVEHLIVQIPDDLVAAAGDTYTAIVPLRSVEVANVQYLGNRTCTADLAFVWSDDTAEIDFDRTSILSRDRLVSLQELSGETAEASFVEFAEDWSSAKVTVECYTGGDAGSDVEYSSSSNSSAIGSSFVVNFPYFVGTDSGQFEERTLAQAPIRIRDDAKLFVSRVKVNDADEPNVPDWAYWVSSQQWALNSK